MADAHIVAGWADDERDVKMNGPGTLGLRIRMTTSSREPTMASEVPVFHGPFAILNLCKCAGLGLKDTTFTSSVPTYGGFCRTYG